MRGRKLGVLGFGILIGCSGSSASPFGAPGGTGSDTSDSGASGGNGGNGATGTTLSDGGSGGATDASSSGGGSGSGGGSHSDGGGSSSGGGDGGGSGSGGGSSGGGPSGTFLPPVQGTCPTIATGTLTFAGQQVQIWAGSGTPSEKGSLVLFWYGTGGHSTDATYLFGQTQIDAVTAAGGLVAAISTTNKQGTDTGDGVWYTGDFDTADQVVACAIQQKWIDTSRIYTTGDSAGGLQATWMAYARSGYIAAAAPLSGGLAGQGGFYAAPVNAPQDPSNVPSALVTHGKLGSDFVGIDFAVASAAYEADIAKKGGFSVDCNTGGGHVSGPPVICPAIWQFFQDHPFKTRDAYGSGLPTSFPSYCAVGPREADGGT